MIGFGWLAVAIGAGLGLGGLWARQREVSLAVLLNSLAIAVGLVGVACLVLAGAARAHDWYPPECCSGRDCFPLADELVEETAGGWLVVPSGALVPRDRARPSRDGRFHLCTHDARPESMPICLFVPPPSI